MSEPVEGRYEGAAQEKATFARRTRDQHIPVSPSRIRLKAVCLQRVSGASSDWDGEMVRDRVFQPVRMQAT